MAPIPTASSATAIDVRAPTRIIDTMSRPYWSVPSQCSPLGPSLWHALIALSIAWWPPYARLVRSQVLTVKEMPYVEAARCMGASRAWILLHHVLPNCLAPVVVQATLDLGSVILTAAGLSFIGLGEQPPLPEWGSMVNSGRLYLATQPWVSAFPGVAILLAVVGFNLFGDGLRDVLDPRMQRGA